MPSPRVPMSSGVAEPSQILSAPMNFGPRNVASFSKPARLTSLTPGSVATRAASSAVMSAAMPFSVIE